MSSVTIIKKTRQSRRALIQLKLLKFQLRSSGDNPEERLLLIAFT